MIWLIIALCSIALGLSLWMLAFIVGSAIGERSIRSK